MNTKNWLHKWLAVCVAVLTMMGSACFAASSSKPNIVHILTDDLGWMDVACYYRAVHGKESIYETPNMDRIASGGMQFMQAYSPSATCSPSRAAYMAGQYPIHTGVLHVIGGIAPTPFRADFPYIDGYYPSRLDLDTPVIADVLKEAGYVTGHIQKWHLGGRSNGYPDPVAYGFDFGWTEGKDYNDPEVWDKNMKHKHEYWSGVWLPSYPNRLQGFGTSDPDDPFRIDPADDDRPFDGVSDLAVRWLDKVKDQDKPFFLNLCPSFVHGPICTRDRKRLEYYCKKMGMPFPETPGKVTDKVDGQVHPYYASMIDSLDWQVGKILSFLETTGDPRNPGHKLIDNTYLIVSSDNGGAEGIRIAMKERIADNSPLRDGKSSVYEGGLRIPFLVQGPGITAGSVYDTPINLIDVFPTFMAMAGSAPRRDLDLDGCNILPLMRGKDTKAKYADGRVRDTLYFSLPVGKTSSSAIRKDGWKLVLNHTPEHNERPAIELFKLYNEDGSVSDLGEARSLVDAHPDKCHELITDLKAWLKKYDAQLPYKNADTAAPGTPLPGADKVPAVLRLVSRGNQVEVHFDSAEGKSKVVSGMLVYTTNGSDLLREHSAYEEWLRAPATLDDGVATAIAPPGMTHGVFCLRDENGFLIRSRTFPPRVGRGGDLRFTITKDPKDSYAWQPGLISLINTGAAALQNAKKKGLDTVALSEAIRVAGGVVKEPVEEEPYATAMHRLRKEIRALDVPEARHPVLNQFRTEKW